MIFRWLKSLFNSLRHTRRNSRRDAVPPTAAEMQAARDRLVELVRPAVFGEIGGIKPEKDNRATSWWGGNFLGAEGEGVPVNESEGREMHPVLQIRVDELPERLPAFDGLALVNIWMDLQSSNRWWPESHNDFVVRTYRDLQGLVPLGVGYRESSLLPTFPVLWRATALEQPSWEDMSEEVPEAVARWGDEEWFFQSSYVTKVDELREKLPIKLGGWPAWIQGSDWPKDAEYFFQVDSNDKGKMYLGDAGSFYVFRTPAGWAIRGDCY